MEVRLGHKGLVWPVRYFVKRRVVRRNARSGCPLHQRMIAKGSCDAFDRDSQQQSNKGKTTHFELTKVPCKLIYRDSIRRTLTLFGRRLRKTGNPESGDS